ncbi:unnamed protein product, partial [Phaeothamnion confervicola]
MASEAARGDVSSWLQTAQQDRIQIDSVKDSTRSINFKANGEIITITYPGEYPNSEEDFLFIETESSKPAIRAVVNDLHEFIYDQPTTLRIGTLLDKLSSFLAKRRGKPAGAAAAADTMSVSDGEHGGGGKGGGASSEDEDESRAGKGAAFAMSDDEAGGGGGGSDIDGDGEADGDEDGIAEDEDYRYEDDEYDTTAGLESAAENQQWLDEHYKKRRWAAAEEEMRRNMAAEAEEKKATEAKTSGAGAGGASRKDKVAQIFSAKGSSQVLISDLLQLQRRSQELGMAVEPVEDNIYHWRVTVNASAFDPSSPLAGDLAALRARFGFGYVELELQFTVDLYPFFPPLVKLVRPRFQGFMMGRIASMDILQLSSWFCVDGMPVVLEGVRKALQGWARLDVDSELNDLALHPEGSYTELEHLLMHLGLVTEVLPRATV